MSAGPGRARKASVQGLRVGDGHGVQDLVEELEGAVEVDLDPTRRLLNALPGVIGAPTFDEAHAEDAEAAEVVDSDAGGGGEAWKGGGGHPVGVGGHLVGFEGTQWGLGVTQ